MKNCRALFGWPQRDSRHYRFAVPNAVWKYRLRPAEFVIFSYLCYNYSSSQVGSVTPEIIAKGVHMTVNTVKKHLTALIVKSPYIKCGGNSSISGYMRYIATRERVELLPDDRPPTRKQEQLIKKLVRDFPNSKELPEYAEWQDAPTKFHASAFISSALEDNWAEVSQSEVYMKYIATRPRAERLGSHGLFGDEDVVDLDKAMSELESYTGNSKLLHAEVDVVRQRPAQTGLRQFP